MKKKTHHLDSKTIRSLNRRMYNLLDVIDKEDRMLILHSKYDTDPIKQTRFNRKMKAQRIYFAIARYISETTGMPFHYSRENKIERNWLV
jgi:hypothetical protein